VKQVDRRSAACRRAPRRPWDAAGIVRLSAGRQKALAEARADGWNNGVT